MKQFKTSDKIFNVKMQYVFIITYKKKGCKKEIDKKSTSMHALHYFIQTVTKVFVTFNPLGIILWKYHTTKSNSRLNIE